MALMPTAVSNAADDPGLEVLSVSNLTKSYGESLAVDGISFVVRRNEIVGLLGPNGAGKTTTINMILGVLEPTGGRIQIEGVIWRRGRSQGVAAHELRRCLRAAARQPHRRAEPAHFGLIYGVRVSPTRIEALLEAIRSRAFRDTKCGVLSSGEQTRVRSRKRC